jgi:Secretion system C-terminal sorting domain
MKHFTLLIVAALMSSMAFAQNFSFTHYVMEINMTATGNHYESTYITNTSGATAVFEYERISNTLNPGWSIQFCDPNFCFLNAHAQDTFTRRNNDQGLFKLDVVGEGIAGTGSLSYRVWRQGFPNEVDTITWNVNTTLVGVADNSLARNVSVYPGLTSTTVSLRANNGVLPRGEASIYDLNGRLQASAAVASVSETSFDVSSLAPGVYLLRFTAGKEVVTRKFVKN